MTAIRIFEPALCCNTGVCGTDVDQALVDITADVKAVTAEGADIERTNLGTDPIRFTENQTAVAFLHTAGSEGLPLVLVDDVTVLTGRYPSRDELRRWAGLTAPEADGRPTLTTVETQTLDEGGCCGGTGCC
ncbi:MULTISPECIES: arsenite efflux transporter metallochaperone ArsD [unclassified Luteococcus]|uniref:arsenite efflux transporter metallochaperone ArsD n=1 Tax=unclassified Luteococcus TaxID=2639923 RepID=UPI00313BE75C